MLGALVKLQAGSSGAADGVLGEHALDSQLHGELGALVHQRAVLDVLEVADPAGVMVVVLVVELLAGDVSSAFWIPLEVMMYVPGRFLNWVWDAWASQSNGRSGRSTTL